MSKPARAKPVPGIERGDHVYVQHPKQGAMAVRVLARGQHGFTAEAEGGARHKLGWDTYVGHKARLMQRYAVVDSGADGSLVEDEAGRRRYLAHDAPGAGEARAASNPDDPVPDTRAAVAAPAPAAPSSTDDPLLGGIARLTKAETMNDGPILFFKAMGQSVANRPGLALQRVTDRAGHTTQRWKRTGGDMPGAEKPGKKEEAPAPASMKHGDTVAFRHGDVEGRGKIVGSGADGVTVDDGEREHQVRHEHLVGTADEGAGGGGAAAGPAAEPGKGGAGGGGGGGGGAGGGGGGGDGKGDGPAGPVPPDQFDAHSYAAQHNDPHVTPDDILKAFPPDTAAKIEDVNKKLAAATQTIDTFKKDGKYTPEREKLHQQIRDRFLSDAKIAAATPPDGQAPTFTILGGRGGSGKSWFDHKVFDPSVSIVLDADAIKQMLPEYEGWNAAVVHEESGDLFDSLTEDARRLGLNIVHDATMKTAKKAVALVEGFKKDGYRTEAHYMYLPPQDAAKRAVARFLGKTRRFVPPGIVLGNTTNEGAFDQVKNLVDAWSFRDNNVSQGTEPKLISEKNDGADSGKPGQHGRPAAGAADGRGAVGSDREAGGSPPGKEGLAKGFPAAGGADGGRVGGPVLFLKAQIAGGASGDLFNQPVNVAGHVKDGKWVAAYTAMRQRRGEAPPVAMSHLAVTPASQPHIARPAPAPAAPPKQLLMGVRPDTMARVVTPDPNSEMNRKLAALQNRATRYEVVCKSGDRVFSLGYHGRRSNAGLVDAVHKFGPRLVSVLGLRDDAQMTVSLRHEVNLSGGGGAKVTFSGRTERDAIMGGELPHLLDLPTAKEAAEARAKELAAMPAATRAPGLGL